MSDAVETKESRKRSPLRWLLLALILSPLTCCGGIYILSALPGVMPILFETEVRIENRTDETLYLTPSRQPTATRESSHSALLSVRWIFPCARAVPSL